VIQVVVWDADLKGGGSPGPAYSDHQSSTGYILYTNLLALEAGEEKKAFNKRHFRYRLMRS
jgi:hypothetical protein